MTTRSSRSATKLALGALVSFAMVAAACGGSDDNGASPGTDAPTVTEGDAPPATEGDADAPPPTEGGDTTESTIAPDQVIDQDDVVDDDTGPQQGGTLRYGLEADVNGINPTSSSLSSPGLMMGNAVFDTLSVFTPEGVAVPYLAESLTPNDDFTQWQVKVREGISFHDGTPLNSAALQVNFEAQRADPLVGLAVKPFFPEEGATELVDDLTIQFNLLEPNVYFPGSLAGQLGMVASPDWIAAALDDPNLNQAPVGTGPFMFDSRSQDSTTKFVRNDGWWGGDVWLDAIEFVPVTDPDTRTDLLLRGELQAIQTTNPASVGDLQDEDSIQNIIDETGEESFAMINSSIPPFDDIRARKAITLATPRENYINLIGLGIARGADQGFVPESQYYNPDVMQEGDDPEGAKALVDEYCAEKAADINTVLGEAAPACTDGKINVELQYSGPAVVQTRIADILSEGWQESFNVTIDELPQDEHILQTALGQYNINTWRQFGATDPAQDNVWLMCRNVGFISLNWPKFCDPERDELLLTAQASTDPAERVALYQELQQKIHDDYLYIFFTHTIWDNAFTENVRGVCDRVTPEGLPTQCASNGRTWFSSVYLV
ncbi:MAG: hypothetical protein HKN44_14965 [Ilumatobacter sp.]|nr:hypothetical protein [Ilumatobacter sp.]